MNACRKSYDDLKRTHCILRGHLRAKKDIRMKSISNIDYCNNSRSRLQERTRFNSLEVGYLNRIANDDTLTTPNLARNKMETMTTWMTHGTDSTRRERKTVKTD